jgi:hypothetical protein
MYAFQFVSFTMLSAGRLHELADLEDLKAVSSKLFRQWPREAWSTLITNKSEAIDHIVRVGTKYYRGKLSLPLFGETINRHVGEIHTRRKRTTAIDNLRRARENLSRGQVQLAYEHLVLNNHMPMCFTFCSSSFWFVKVTDRKQDANDMQVIAYKVDVALDADRWKSLCLKVVQLAGTCEICIDSSEDQCEEHLKDPDSSTIIKFDASQLRITLRFPDQSSVSVPPSSIQTPRPYDFPFPLTLPMENMWEMRRLLSPRIPTEVIDHVLLSYEFGPIMAELLRLLEQHVCV